jgi:hypothetical protein
MERNRNKKAKALRASGRQSVKNEIQKALHTRMESGRELVPNRNYTKTQRHVRRWNQTAAVANQAFTLADGHNQFLVITTIGGNAVPYVDSWRIRRISVWAQAQGNFATAISIVPTAGTTDNMIVDPEAIYQCQARSEAQPASMHIYPSEEKPLGAWKFTSNVSFAATLFQMNITNNGGASSSISTLEIEFETRKNDVGLPLGYGVVTGTTTLGTLGGRNVLSGYNLTGINNLG